MYRRDSLSDFHLFWIWLQYIFQTSPKQGKLLLVPGNLSFLYSVFGDAWCYIISNIVYLSMAQKFCRGDILKLKLLFIAHRCCKAKRFLKKLHKFLLKYCHAVSLLKKQHDWTYFVAPHRWTTGYRPFKKSNTVWRMYPSAFLLSRNWRLTFRIIALILFFLEILLCNVIVMHVHNKLQ